MRLIAACLLLALAAPVAMAELVSDPEVHHFGDWTVYCGPDLMYENACRCYARPAQNPGIRMEFRNPPLWSPAIYWVNESGEQISTRIDDERVHVGGAGGLEAHESYSYRKKTLKANRLIIRQGTNPPTEISTRGLRETVEFLLQKPMYQLRPSGKTPYPAAPVRDMKQACYSDEWKED